MIYVTVRTDLEMRMELSQIKSFHFPMLRLSSKLYNFGIHFYLNLFISQSLICLMHSLVDALFFRFFMLCFTEFFKLLSLVFRKNSTVKRGGSFFLMFLPRIRWLCSFVLHREMVRESTVSTAKSLWMVLFCPGSCYTVSFILRWHFCCGWETSSIKVWIAIVLTY